PPFSGERRKTGDLGGVDGGRGFGGVAQRARFLLTRGCRPRSAARRGSQARQPACVVAGQGLLLRLWRRLAAIAERRPSRYESAPSGFFRYDTWAMARLVMKFGGTSVADIPRIRNVARHVKREVDAGNEVAVVVSAMAGTTNQLVAWTREASALHDAREYDTVVSSGEQVTSGLLAIALQAIGVNARSWQGWQIPVRADAAHGAARIVGIDGSELIRRLRDKQVAVVAGFQGIGPDNRIATLGRGGSDTSAVALAAAVEADRCDIYTDVDGVYTTDPRVEQKARRLAKISYEEMLEMASLGAKVLQVRSVELAMMRGVRTFVRSSFVDPEAPELMHAGHPPGTLICDEEEIVE